MKSTLEESCASLRRIRAVHSEHCHAPSAPRVLSIPRWALGDRVMLCLKASHSEIPEIYLGTRKPELYENESRSLMTTAPRLVG